MPVVYQCRQCGEKLAPGADHDCPNDSDDDNDDDDTEGYVGAWDAQSATVSDPVQCDGGRRLPPRNAVVTLEKANGEHVTGEVVQLHPSLQIQTADGITVTIAAYRGYTEWVAITRSDEHGLTKHKPCLGSLVDPRCRDDHANASRVRLDTPQAQQASWCGRVECYHDRKQMARSQPARADGGDA
jgi:hypothetical protein